MVLYNTLIDKLSKVGWEEDGLSLLAERKTEKKNRPNIVPYNCLIDGLCKAERKCCYLYCSDICILWCEQY